MKHVHKYILLIIVFIVLIVGLTFTHLYINYKENGSVEIIKKYYEILLLNTIVYDEVDMSVKINNAQNFIHVEIPDIIKNNEVKFSLDVKNIGNDDVLVKNFVYANIDSNLDTSLFTIDSTLKKDDVIKGGQEKKLVVRVRYNGNEDIDNSYFNFNINYTFDGLNL